jgi:hypothetical protein
VGRDASDIIDRATGKVRVFDDKCSTCVFRPGNLMFLREGQFEEIIAANLKAGALLTCHQTLPYAGTGIEPTACGGFWKSYGLQTMAGRLAKAMIGIIFVKPPEKEQQ